MNYTNKEELAKLSLCTIYRMLVKNMKDYPSKNRFPILLAIKEGSPSPHHFGQQFTAGIYWQMQISERTRG